MELTRRDARNLVERLATLRAEGRVFTEETHQGHLAVTLTGISYAILLTLNKHIPSSHIGGTSATPDAVDGYLTTCREFLDCLEPPTGS